MYRSFSKLVQCYVYAKPWPALECCLALLDVDLQYILVSFLTMGNDSDVLGGKQRSEIAQDRQEERSKHDSRGSGIKPPKISAASMSIRLSCDRCRLQKLKCAVPAGSDICERCTRAKVSCLFGRRTYSKRKTQASNKSRSSTVVLRSWSPVASQSLPTSGTSMATGSSGLKGLASDSPSMSSSNCSDYSSPFPDWSLDSFMIGSTTELDNYIGTFDFDDQQSCDHEDTCRPCSTAKPDHDSDFDQITTFLQWGPENHVFEEENNQPLIIAQDTAPPEQAAQSVILPTATGPSSQESNISVANIHPATSHSDSSKASSQTSLQLTCLVSQIQNLLRELEGSSWRHMESKTNLDDYPVDNILELSQKFGALAGDILNVMTRPKESSDNPARFDTSSDQRTGMLSLPSELAVDTPAVLLVMAGYLCIMQIYSLLLKHFNQYLNNMPRPGANEDVDKVVDYSSAKCVGKATASSPTTMTVSTTLPSSSPGQASRLHGLLSTNTVLYLYQISTAVRMVQDELRDIERRLGRGGVFARDMALTLLRSPSNRLDSSLEETATGIKELIREKFHF